MGIPFQELRVEDRLAQLRDHRTRPRHLHDGGIHHHAADDDDDRVRPQRRLAVKPMIIGRKKNMESTWPR